VRLPPSERLDLGGVAKGWVALQTVRRLQAFGPTLVDAGGDIALSPRPAAQPWTIGVADPLTGAPHPDLLLQLTEGGVATSGRDYRRWRAGDEPDTWHHHILDPRTGRPAETDVLTATVIAPGSAGSAVAAEVAAKTALILGSRGGLEWLEGRAPLAGVLMLEDGRVLCSSRMDDFLWGAQEIYDGDIRNQNATRQSIHLNSFCC
jgi:thiamine biosynthesis lipoprotein